MLLTADRSVLLVVDVQERLIPALEGGDRVVAQAQVLIAAARTLAVPILVSEQYPRGLGPTVAPVLALIDHDAVFEKVHFSCLGAPGFSERLARLGRDQIVIAGVEAHVCVLQTALDLRADGRSCAVVADATASRLPASAERGLQRMAAHGVDIVTTEMVVFEWLHRAGTPAFKTVSALIR